MIVQYSPSRVFCKNPLTSGGKYCTIISTEKPKRFGFAKMKLENRE